MLKSGAQGGAPLFPRLYWRMQRMPRPDKRQQCRPGPHCGFVRGALHGTEAESWNYRYIWFEFIYVLQDPRHKFHEAISRADMWALLGLTMARVAAEKNNNECHTIHCEEGEKECRQCPHSPLQSLTDAIENFKWGRVWSIVHCLESSHWPKNWILFSTERLSRFSPLLRTSCGSAISSF